MNKRRRPFRVVQDMFHSFLVMGGAMGFTLAFFLILPLMQAINSRDKNDLVVQNVQTMQLEPPEAPPEPEVKEEPKEEPEPPELDDAPEQIPLSQMEIALGNELTGGWGSIDTTVNLKSIVNRKKSVDDILSISDLDQKPRVIYQAGPPITRDVRKQTQTGPGTVYVVFVVNEDGRVEKPMVQKSTHPAFDKPALTAVSKWKFEPGKRGGKPVRFRMRVPITFPKGL